VALPPEYPMNGLLSTTTGRPRTQAEGGQATAPDLHQCPEDSGKEVEHGRWCDARANDE
jgi:hypothetical protein